MSFVLEHIRQWLLDRCEMWSSFVA